MAAGTDSFTVRFDSSGCIFPVTVVSSNTPPAVYTLVSGGTPPNCAGAAVNGNYTIGTSVDGTHFTAVQVNVTTIGTYSLAATGGGLSFSATGTFTATGVQTVLLRASGIPTVQGTVAVSFAAPFGACSFAVNVNGPAVFTINCAAATVNGTYVDRALLDPSHTILLPVTVTVPGNFKLSVTSSGMTFADSGHLATGPQTITLKGTGSPTTWGLVNLTVGMGGCVVPIPVQATTGSRMWRFTVGGVLYEGPINSSSTLYSGSNYTLTLNGVSQSPAAGYSFLLVMSKLLPPNSTSSDVLGTYSSTGSPVQGRAALRLDNGIAGFAADSVNGNLTVIRSVLREGSFSGSVQNSSGATVALTNGYFLY